MACAAAEDLPFLLDFGSGIGAGADLVFGAGEVLVAAGFWATGFLGEDLATGFLAGTLATGFEGLETFAGAFLAGAGFFETGLAAGFLTGFGGAFFAAGFFAGAGFFGAGAFLAGFVLEIEREELFGEDLDLVFKRLSFKSFTLGQKATSGNSVELQCVFFE